MRNKGLTFLVVLVALGLITLSLPRLVFPYKEDPVSEPQIEYIPDTLSIVSYSTFIAGHEGEYVSAYVNAGGRTSNLLYYSYQWYVWTPSRGYWIPSTLSGANTREISFQMTPIRSEYLFACVVSYQGYPFSVISPEINCHLLQNNSKGSGNFVCDYYEPWELDDLSEDVKKQYFEKLNSESGEKYESSTVETTMDIKKDDSYIEETIPTEIEQSTESEGE